MSDKEEWVIQDQTRPNYFIEGRDLNAVWVDQKCGKRTVFRSYKEARDAAVAIWSSWRHDEDFPDSYCKIICIKEREIPIYKPAERRIKL